MSARRGICPCNWRCGVGVCSEHDRKRYGRGCRRIRSVASRQISDAPSRLRGQLGARRVQARTGRLLSDQRSQAARTCRSCSEDPAPNDVDSCFGRTRRRGYRLTRTVCGPLGRRCAKGLASAIYKSSALMVGLSASCSAAFSSELSSAARLR